MQVDQSKLEAFQGKMLGDMGAAVSAAAGSPLGIAIAVAVVAALLVYVVLVRPRRAAKAVTVED